MSNAITEHSCRITDAVVSDDFQCPCCGDIIIVPDIIASFGSLALECDDKVSIESGYRCRHHNEEVGGHVESLHLRGAALDICWPFNQFTLALRATRHFSKVLYDPISQCVHVQNECFKYGLRIKLRGPDGIYRYYNLNDRDVARRLRYE